MKGPPFYLGPRADIRLSDHSDVEVGRGVQIMADFTGSFYATVRIGAGTFINRGGYLVAHEGLRIGEGCLIGEYTSIHDADHPFGPDWDPSTSYQERGFVARPILIGRRVWIGARCTITSGVTIGDEAVVAANAVVTSDVAPRTLVGGVPARVLRDWAGPASIPASGASEVRS